MTRRQKDPLRPLTREERAALEQLSRARSEPASHVARARLVLAVAAGQSYTAAARGVGRRSPTWCRNNGLRGHSIRDEDATPLTGQQAELGQRGDDRLAVF